MSKYVTATRHTYRLLSLGYLLLSWSLLLWLNFAIEPNVFAHLVAIPSLLLATGLSALYLGKRPERH
ncbi:hypothetical protein LZP73_18345 [Shewanella sp. AS16]|uniref:hypothetical protein n=1 Tax=Shewanella sp. AS16 TaxID=2907625 RepID=UPI001F39CDE1|nr:hypothetical protein [Shewanella sp. AS16]MCE9688140.1 hypothetical protein [Shewanella sp. AS16]